MCLVMSQRNKKGWLLTCLYRSKTWTGASKKRLKTLVWVQKMDLYEHPNGIPPPVHETARPSRPGRVSYEIVNLYLTLLEDLSVFYYVGVQLNRHSE